MSPEIRVPFFHSRLLDQNMLLIFLGLLKGSEAWSPLERKLLLHSHSHPLTSAELLHS